LLEITGIRFNFRWGLWQITGSRCGAAENGSGFGVSCLDLHIHKHCQGVSPAWGKVSSLPKDDLGSSNWAAVDWGNEEREQRL
jgi:hypothetical protein